MVFEIKYVCQGLKKCDTFTDSNRCADFEVKLVRRSNGFSLDIAPLAPLQLISITAKQDYTFQKDDSLFLNGYQSWTDSRELSINSIMHGLKHTPKVIQDKYLLRAYGDYDLVTYAEKRGKLHGFSYGYIKRDKENYMLIGSLSERNGFTVIHFDTNNNTIILSKDCEGVIIDKPYKAFDIAMLHGSESEVFDSYFQMMGINKPKAKHITGYTSWYNHYQNINEDIINKNIDAAIKSSLSFYVFQIDDGYQAHVGDWTSVDKKKFPQGLTKIASRIRENGMLPGIWLAPFACEYGSETAKKHPDWLLKDKKGKPVKAGCNWGGFYALDFYNAEVKKYIKDCFDTIINEWGFGFLKLDFLYAACMAPDEHHTRGQVMCEAMDFLRECAGDALLLGCGVPLAPAFGKVDYCRIGCDVGLDYDDKPYMRLLHRERVSTKNSIGNTIYRRQLSGRAFINDPDVFLLRDDNIKLNKKQKQLLAKVNSLFGGVLFTSDDVSSYNKWQMTVLQETLTRKPQNKVKVFREGKYTYIIADNETLKIKL